MLKYFSKPKKDHHSRVFQENLRWKCLEVCF